MLTIRDEADLAQVADTGLRELVADRLADLCQEDTYDPDVQGFVIVMEPGDSLAAVESGIGAPLLKNPVTGQDYGHPDFQPVTEYIGRHAHWYEVVVVPGDGDFGVILFVPRRPDIEPRLLALCAEYAVTESARV